MPLNSVNIHCGIQRCLCPHAAVQSWRKHTAFPRLPRVSQYSQGLSYLVHAYLLCACRKLHHFPYQVHNTRHHYSTKHGSMLPVVQMPWDKLAFFIVQSPAQGKD